MAETTDPTLTAYDYVPYDLAAFPQTHIGSLAAIGRLFGLRPANPRHCRVLELACGLGGNLLAMAESFPNSQFWGYDLSSRQIATGHKLAHAIGLSNLSLETADIADLDFGEAKFDFILCHGAFSWVPAHVQKRVFALCQKHLSPEGIAYISYNTQPGWQLRSLIRDTMRYHAGKVSDPKERVTQGIAILEFLGENLAAFDPVFQAFVNQQLETLRHFSFSYVFHEYFGEMNRPVYFHQFMEQAEQHGLRYLGEASPSSMSVYALPPKIIAALQAPPDDSVRLEQYCDFRTNRSFRQTLLCHADRPVRTKPDTRVLFTLYASLPIRLEGESNGQSFFISASGMRATTVFPLATAILKTLSRVGAYPLYMPAVLRQIRSRDSSIDRLDDDTMEKTADLLGKVLFYGGGCVYTAVPHIARRPSRRPRASQLARIMAGRGPRVFTPLNRLVMLDTFARCLIQHLDGTNERTDLVALLLEDCHSGRFDVMADNRKITGEEAVQNHIASAVIQVLDQLASNHLLVN
jgi:methyltransferase-like protein/SAM-dependent methyltransferase